MSLSPGNRGGYPHGVEGMHADDLALNSAFAGIAGEEQQRVQLLEETSKVRKIEIQEATITFKEFSAVAVGHPPSNDAPINHVPSGPAGANCVMNDHMDLLVNEMSSIGCTLERVSQQLAKSNKLENELSSMRRTLESLLEEVQKSNKLKLLEAQQMNLFYGGSQIDFIVLKREVKWAEAILKAI